MNELKSLLMSEARDKGICEDGYKEMRNIADRMKMVDYYVSNPDWCMERDFPTLDMLEKYFDDCGDKGVFVGRKFNGELLNDLQTYIFHNCKGTVKVGLNIEKGIIPMLYIANGCRLRIVGTGEVVPSKKNRRSEVPVYTFGRNDISIRDNKFVKFIHYK